MHCIHRRPLQPSEQITNIEIYTFIVIYSVSVINKVNSLLKMEQIY